MPLDKHTLTKSKSFTMVDIGMFKDAEAFQARAPSKCILQSLAPCFFTRDFTSEKYEVGIAMPWQLFIEDSREMPRVVVSCFSLLRAEAG